MEQKNVLQFSREINGKVFTAHFPEGTQYGEAYDFGVSLVQHFAEGIRTVTEKTVASQQQHTEEESNGSN